MSLNSFTSSERRGILAIALVALLCIGGGVLISLSERQNRISAPQNIVEDLPELTDSLSSIEKNQNKTKKKAKTKKSNNKKSKEKKTYRRRSPLDEPV